ncbi:hypothetical protein [Brevundimonas goettingensis]|uniref:DUF4410 domain-containing protein n=1 Tax=Brevundimonas goettingensis TaxID=2774190 RepID=A0A975C3R8_9CAUL|nr:hypothetical protein [Brevundimonas goettingensis]QTC91027.1 hypothetical protein IFJ75_17685 [Brevundimonas goettingensis]
MSRLPLAVALLAGLSLSACVGMSRSAPVTALDPAAAAGLRVSEIRLTTDDKVTVRPEFAGIFRDRVQTKLDGCATGARPLRLEATISRLDRANPAQVLLIGGANVLRGHARLVDPANGRVVGEYDIGRTIIGGRLGVFQMAESEEQLSDAFGAELCDQAFKAG